MDKVTKGQSDEKTRLHYDIILYYKIFSDISERAWAVFCCSGSAAKSLHLPHNTAQYRTIPHNTAQYRKDTARILQGYRKDTARIPQGYCKIPQDTTRYCKILQDTARYHKRYRKPHKPKSRLKKRKRKNFWVFQVHAAFGACWWPNICVKE